MIRPIQHFLLFSALTLGSTFSLGAPEKPEPLDAMVAIVNSEIISRTELDKEEAFIKSSLENTKTPLPPEDQFRKQVLDHLISQKLQLQMATRLGVALDDATLQDALNTMAKENHQTLEEWKKQLEQKGFSFDEYKNQIKKQLIAEKLIQQEVGGRVYISNEEIKNVLNSEAFEAQHQTQYHLQDILIALPDVPSSEEVQKAQRKAQEILTALKAGKNFQQLAMGQSNGHEALKGGDLGWRSPQELPEVFLQYVKKMAVGEVSPPIRTPNGYHVIKLVEAKGVDSRHFVTETKVRHILLIKNALLTDEEIKTKLNNIRQAVLKGESFADFAEKNSQDPLSASKGGDLGWVKPGVLVPSFEATMNQLKEGELSEPVESQYGWHLIQVEGRKQVDDTVAYRNSQIRRMLFQREFDEKVENWLQEMRQASYVRVMDDAVA